MRYNWYRDLIGYLAKYECDVLFSFDINDINIETINRLRKQMYKIIDIIKNKIVEEDISRMQCSSSLSHYKYIRKNVRVECFLNDNIQWSLVKLWVQLRLMFPRFTVKSKTVILNGMNLIYKNDINPICNLCKDGVEDLYHFICKCQNYALMRSTLSTKLAQSIPASREDFVRFVADMNETKLKLISTLLTQANEITETFMIDT